MLCEFLVTQFVSVFRKVLHGHQSNQTVRNFNSEDRCRELLEMLRWPSGVCCLRCGDVSVSKLEKRHQYECNGCRYQFSATAGSGLHDSHLPLWKWFLATYLICEGKKGISANQLKRTLGISYKTAWYLCHRIREAMKSDTSAKLNGIVEADETFMSEVYDKRRKRAAYDKTHHSLPSKIQARMYSQSNY